MEATAELFAEGFRGPYGVAFDMDENLLVGERQSGCVQKIAPDGHKSLFIQLNGQPCDLKVDDSNDLFVALINRHQLSIVSPEQEVAVYAHSCHGRRFAGPHSLCFDPDGNLLFSDADGCLYSADLDGEVEEYVKGLDGPEGMIFSEDAGTLYVAESGKNRIVSFELDDDGNPGPAEEFHAFDGGGPPHALLFDSEGTLYVSREGVGISLLDPDANPLTDIALPGAAAAGMCFGGLDYNELFVAEHSGGGIYRIALEHAGQRPFAGPRAI